MRKNGSRLISLSQYRLTDLFLFAVILIIFDLISHFAPMAFGDSADFIFTLTVPLVITVMIRWGWWSVLFAVLDGLLFTVLNNPAVWQTYISYIGGNAFIMLLLIPVKLFGKERLAGKWYFSTLLVIAGWALQNLGISLLLLATTGGDFVYYLSVHFGLGATGALSLAMGIVVVLIIRRFNGLFEDQKSYIRRLDREREEKSRIDDFGEEPIDLDEEALNILKKDNEK